MWHGLWPFLWCCCLSNHDARTVQLTDELFPFAVSLLRTFLMTTTSWVSSFRLLINNGQSMYSHGRLSCMRVSVLLTFLGGVSQTRIYSCYCSGSFWSRLQRENSDVWLKKRYFPLYIATGSNKVYHRRWGEEVKCLVFIYHSMVLTPSNFRK